MKRAVLIIITILLVNTFSKAQIILDKLYNGEFAYEISAPEYVRMMPGFQSTPKEETPFKVIIDPNNLALTPIHYIEGEPIDPLTRQLEYSYPVGTTTGQASVSLTGGATYSIPIFASPGTAGMQPSVSLSYNSQSGNGIAGYGWNISGLSSISRVPHTLYHDGDVKGIDFSDDRFALDGQRLIKIDGDYGTDSCEYYTEVFNGSKIVSHGTLGGGPLWFEVFTKDGKTIQYGNTNDSRLQSQLPDNDVISWNINKITDANGNYILFNYYKNAIECYIKEIKYTGNDSATLKPYNSIKFYYGERTDKSTAFIAGSRIEQTVLLDHIDIICESEIIRTYKLKYYLNFYSKLNEIEEYGNNNSRYNSTVFGYNDNDSNPYCYEISEPTIMASHGDQIIYQDFNRDGLTDIFYKNGHTNLGSNDKWSVYLNNGSGINNIPIWEQNFGEDENKVYPGDFNGDGLPDIIYIEEWGLLSNNWNLKCLINNGSGFTDYLLFEGGIKDSEDSFNVYAFDMDGDAKDEYIIHYDYAGSDEIKGYKIDFEGGTYVNVELPNVNLGIGGIVPEIKTINIAEFNGNGGYEILVTYDDEDISEIFTFSTANYFTTKIYEGFPGKYHTIYTGDFNGDGITDLLTSIETSGTHLWELHYWLDTYFLTEQLNDLTFDDEFGVAINDFNNDNKSDITYRTQTPLGGNEIGIYINHVYFNGESILKSIPFLIAETTPIGAKIISENINNRSIDFNGDGIPDFIIEGTYGVPYIVICNPYERQNLVQSIANGLNKKYIYRYSTIPDLNSYSITEFQNYPLRSIPLVTGIVESLSESNGLGTYTTQSFEYADAILHLKGKGFLGYKSIITSSDISSIETKSDSEIDEVRFYLYPKGSNSSKIDGLNSTLLSESVFENSKKTGYESTGIVFLPYQTSTTNKDYLTQVKIVNESEIDNFGNAISNQKKYYPSFSSQTPTGYSLTEFFNYVNGAAWCPSLPSDVKTTNMLSSETVPFIKNDHYEYWDITANPKLIKNFYCEDKEIVTYYPEEEYTSCGLPEKVIVTPKGLESRINSYVYDSKNRFIIQSINPMGHSELYSYDAALGVKVSETDCNSLEFKTSYDGFGNAIRSTGPEGIWENSELKWYNGDKANVLFYSESTSNNSPTSWSFIDITGNVLYSSFEDFNNRIVLTKKEFNSKGQLISVSEPYFNGELPSKFTYYEYDDFNRVIKTTLPTDNYLTNSYPSPDQPGLTISVFNNATGITTSKTTDALGQVISADDPGGTTTYTYFSDGNPKEITAADGSKISMTFDIYGRQLSLSDPDAGNMEYIYNAFGELIYQKDAKGNEFDFSYDKLGRILQKKSRSGNTVIEYVYDVEPNGKGLISSISQGNGTSYSYKYDQYSRIRQKTIVTDQSYSYNYDYDGKGNLKNYIYPTGFSITNNYKPNGYLLNVVKTSDGTPLYTPEVYNVRGQLCNWKLGEFIYNENKYDEFGFPTNIYCGTGSGLKNIQNLGTRFNELTGNLEYKTDRNYKINNKDLEENFTFDPVHKNRLESWTVTGQNTCNMTYSDNNGNILTKTHVTTSGNPFIYNQLKPHAIESINDPAYIPAEVYQSVLYNEFNKVSSIEQNNRVNRHLEIIYGPDEQRIKSIYSIDGTTQKTRYFIGGDFEIEVSSDNKETFLHYLPGGGLYVSSKTDDPKMYYILTDYQGNWYKVINTEGETIETYSFDPWGQRRNPKDWTYLTVPQTFLFDRGYTGHEHLDDFGLINMNGRVYDPVIARFLSPDPFVQAPDNSQGFNRYSYCLNNPLIYSDPTGEVVDLIAILAIGAWANIAAQGLSNNINCFQDFTLAAGVGAVSALAGVYAGQALIQNITFGGFYYGSIEGAASGAISGFIGGAGNAWSHGNDFLDGIRSGIFGMGTGFVSGGVIGGLRRGISDYRNGYSFLSGTKYEDLIVGLDGGVKDTYDYVHSENLIKDTELLKSNYKNIYDIEEGLFKISKITTHPGKYKVLSNNMYLTTDGYVAGGYAKQTSNGYTEIHISPKYATGDIVDFKAVAGHELLHVYHHFNFPDTFSKIASENWGYKLTYDTYMKNGRFWDALNTKAVAIQLGYWNNWSGAYSYSRFNLIP